MLGVDARAFRVSWTVLVVAGAAGLLYLVRGALLVLVLAILFAYVVWPLVEKAEALARRLGAQRLARLWGLALVYPLLMGLALLAGVVLAPQITEQAANLVDKVSAFAGQIRQGNLLDEMSRRSGWSLPTLYAMRDKLMVHAGALLPYLRSAGAQLLHYLSNLWLVVLVPILAFFLLKDAERFREGLESWLVERGHREFLRAVLEDLHQLLAHYMRSVVVLSFLTFASHLLFFWAAGVPYGLLLASAAGMLEFIPLVGPLGAAALIVLAAWLAGYGHLVWILIFLGAWRLVQDYVNMPLVIGSGIELHPLLVILGVVGGAELAGVAGMFLSIPTLVAVMILVRHSLPRAAPEPATEEPPARRSR